MDEDDEYARWTREAGTSDLSASRAGPAAGLALFAQQRRRKRSDDDGVGDDDDMELDEEERGPQRNWDSKDSRSQYQQYEQHNGSRTSQQRSDRGDGTERALTDSNIGHQMLLKLGWAGTGTGLGSNAQGRSQPLALSFAKLGADTSGIGKLRSTSLALDDAMSLSKLHTLNSERIATETAEERAAREADNRAKEKIRTDVQASLNLFRCEICGGKQYENASQMAEHLNSYAHHHRKRLKELASNQRALLSGGATGGGGGGSVGEKRREKERKREEREMKAFAQAAGIQLATQAPSNSAPLRSATAWSSQTPLTSTRTAAPLTSVTTTRTSGSSGGWRTVSSSSTSGGGFRKIGSSSMSSTIPDPSQTQTLSRPSAVPEALGHGNLQPPSRHHAAVPPPRLTSSEFRPVQPHPHSSTHPSDVSRLPEPLPPLPPLPPTPPSHLALSQPNHKAASLISPPTTGSSSPIDPVPTASRARRQYPTFHSGGY